jgi:hypothetical protein
MFDLMEFISMLNSTDFLASFPGLADIFKLLLDPAFRTIDQLIADGVVIPLV